MAQDLVENFEGGTNGVAITGANSAFTSSVGPGTVTFDNAFPAHGTLAAKFVNSANTITLQSTITASQTRTMRRYWRISTLPASGVFLIFQTVKLGAVAATGTLRVGSTGTIQMRDGNTTVATTTTAISVDQYFRYEWQIDGAGATQTLKLFVGSNVDGDTPDETVGGTYSGGNFDTVVNGINSTTTNTTMRLDDALDDTALVTIGSAAPATGSIFTFTHTVTIG